MSAEAVRVLAIRHGETAWNVDTRIQGQLDIPLNDNGRWQAQRLARALASRDPIDTVYTSDLLRAWDTARAVSDAAGVALVLDEGLRERGFGVFEGQTFAEIEARWPQESQRWRQRDPHWAPEGGESLSQMRERVLATLARLAAAHRGEQIVLVAHGGVMDMLYREATGLGLQAPRTWQLGNAAVNRLLWTPDSLTLVGWSDTSHLDDDFLEETTA
ncbi:MAG: histidine phosphatase family protein [Ramlibacter sp.]|jgi:probable phosphoglycerate mutase|nr:histidine phosphatase family protein [Ramlibacter sp.]